MFPRPSLLGQYLRRTRRCTFAYSLRLQAILEGVYLQCEMAQVNPSPRLYGQGNWVGTPVGLSTGIAERSAGEGFA
jgi:hypothetical protein